MTEVVELESVRRRLEAFLHAINDKRIPLVVTDPAEPISWWRRYVVRRKPGVRASRAFAANDGTRIWLPRVVSGLPDVDAATVYRLLALMQVEFVTRGASAEMQHFRSAFERDLFTVYEAAAAEHTIALTHPGLAGAILSLRRRAARHQSIWFGGATALFERLRDEVLATDPRDWPRSLPRGLDSVGARSWATGVAGSFNSRLYYPSRRVWHWGTILDPARTRARDASGMPQMGMVFLPIGQSPQQAAPMRGEALAQSGDAGTAGDTSDAGSASVADDSQSGTATDAWNQPSRDIPGLGSDAVFTARYHEWDHTLAHFERDRVSVFESVVRAGDSQWAIDTARANRGLIRRVEREFQTLGAHRQRLRRRQSGDELDIRACVDLRVAVRSRRMPDERVYRQMRPPRGGVALAILADVSGSAEATLVPGVRIIDIERVALLVATHALEATGDRHALLAFSSIGAPRVAVRTAKSFDERGGPAVGARIAALEAVGNTRLGAAIRHASTVLLRERAARHLLLVISDGLPNDTDGYVDDYGIEDARMAVLEARARGVMPHCLTLSAEEHYALRIFGSAAQVLVRKPEHLPAAMLDVLGRLLRR